MRGLLREPGFAAVAVLALAIGVGSSTAMFSVVEAVLLRPLPYTAPERLMLLLSVAFWRRELGADPRVLGRTLELDHKVVAIVGVLPRGLSFPRLERCELF